MKPQQYIQLAITIFLLSICNSGKSQSTLGISTGANYSSINFENTDPLWRYYLGLQSQIPLSGKFSFNPQLLYSQKGWKFNSISSMEPGGEMNLHYVDLQLAGKYTVNNFLGLLGGVEIGRLVEARRDPDVSFLDDFYKKNDFSLLMGVDFSLAESIRIELKYLHGLSYLAKFDTTDVNGNFTGTVKEGNLRLIQMGVSFDIIKIRGKDI